ncbi:homoserine dehydrogenase [Arthrobacter roseus]|uniref:homoserine dehydrogenase n=1 Tax=Arthrobacter roseus TaxID=136274 RepID=UPI003083F269|nr:homoserine dehydrogenase [Arthrobacter roseus]
MNRKLEDSNDEKGRHTVVLRTALLGCGSVGSQVARILLEEADSLEERIGARLELTGIAVRDTNAIRDVELPPELFTTNATALVKDADIVIELMGGIEPAKTLILAAIENGASVVTGNKALLAQHGPALYEKADAAGVQLSYEAAVAGAVPIVRPIRDSLSGDKITRVLGIVNGTTNYILDQMDSTGVKFYDALADAQQLGYAEADPTADVDGHDAASKAAILATLSFHTRFRLDRVFCEGIRHITAEDIAAAKDAGYVIKLLAIAERTTTGDGDEGVSVRVHPSLLRRTHPLAAVHGAFNAVFVEAEGAGELMFYGQGAGGVPTASAVLGDVVSAARRLVLGGPGRTEIASAEIRPLPIDTVMTSYAIGVEVVDESGVLASIASLFAGRGVSIESMHQSTGQSAQGSAELRFVTHRARESALAATVRDLADMDVVKTVISVLRVEGE